MRTILFVLLAVVLVAMAVFFLRFNQFMGIVVEQAKLVKGQEPPAEIKECGNEPVDPWNVKESVTQWDLDVYRRTKEAWERCVHRFRMHAAKDGGTQVAGNPALPPLQEYRESPP